MTDFQVVCLRGLFGWSDRLYLESTPGHREFIDEALQPLLDRYIEMHLHFEPQAGPIEGLPGLGCCVRERRCPTHHAHPDLMLSFRGTGILRTDGAMAAKWWLEPPLGGPTQIIPLDVLPWHYGRLMAHTILDLSGVDSHRG